MMLPLLAAGLSPFFATTHAGAPTTTNQQAPGATATSPDAAIPPGVFKAAPKVSAGSTGGSSSPLPPPPEDDCLTPLSIAGAGTFAFDLTMATTGTQGQTNSACLIGPTAGIGNDVWYAWTATASGDYSLTTCGLTTIDSKIAVYPGSGCPTGAAVVCSDDTCSPAGNLQTTLTFTAVATQTYTIQLGVYPLSAVSSGSFTIAALAAQPCGRIDDGIAENAGGWTAGGEYVWMQSFGTIGQQFTLAQVEVAWGSTVFPTGSPPNGSPCKVAVWEDPNDDGNPADAVLLSLVSTTVMNNATGVYNPINLTAPVTINGVFFVGAGMPHAAMQFPMPMDKNGPGASLHRAWRFGNNTATPVDYGVFTNNLFLPKAIHTIATAFEACVTVRYVCQSAPGTTYCDPGASGVLACPCGNAPGGAGKGCNNSLGGGGAAISGTGNASLAADTAVLSASGIGSTTGSCAGSSDTLTWILLQGDGNTAAGLGFNDGVRCFSGTLKRIQSGTSVGGVATSTVSISAQSAALGDTIGANTSRYYGIWYRDPCLTFACASPSNSNVSNGYSVLWTP